MDKLEEIIRKATIRPYNLSVEELRYLIELTDEASRKKLADAAYRLKCHYCGKLVSIRGLIEAGNVCAKDCCYCGIRRSNGKVKRYRLSEDEIIRLAQWNAANRYASLVIQSGEIESEENTSFIEGCLNKIRHLNLGVTLSLGEQSEEAYRRWKEAGALRYLLRIETSNQELYRQMHPADHSWERRCDCLRILKKLGYLLGTGTMSALPGQTSEDLARDIVFFRDIEADMIGMGPYIPHPDTPMGATAPALPDEERMRIALNMIAATRLYLHNVNIAATTALQALAHDGRERGILCGANVLMPNTTDVEYRRNYQLYAGKPCLDENAALCRNCLERRLNLIGEKINWGQLGDRQK